MTKRLKDEGEGNNCAKLTARRDNDGLRVPEVGFGQADHHREHRAQCGTDPQRRQQRRRVYMYITIIFKRNKSIHY